MGNLLGGESGSKKKGIRHLERYIKWLDDFSCMILDESIFGDIPEMEDRRIHPGHVFRFMKNWIDILMQIIDKRIDELSARQKVPNKDINYRSFKFYVKNNSKILEYEQKWKSLEDTIMFRPEASYESSQNLRGDVSDDEQPALPKKQAMILNGSPQDGGGPPPQQQGRVSGHRRSHNPPASPPQLLDGGSGPMAPRPFSIRDMRGVREGVEERFPRYQERPLAPEQAQPAILRVDNTGLVMQGVV